MKVFHGSTVEIQYPLANIGRDNLDFGKGFYATDIYNQAEHWASAMKLRRPGTIATINVYELNINKISFDNYNSLHFNGYNNDWLDFVVNSRRGEKPMARI